jgi:hypothetical protein
MNRLTTEYTVYAALWGQVAACRKSEALPTFNKRAGEISRKALTDV